MLYSWNLSQLNSEQVNQILDHQPPATYKATITEFLFMMSLNADTLQLDALQEQIWHLQNIYRLLEAIEALE